MTRPHSIRALLLAAALASPAAAQTCPGSIWALRTPSSLPAPRSNHGLVFDSARSRAVLFGGQGNAGALGDTWEWNGAAQTWTLRIPAGSPPSPRHGHAMTFDSARSRTVLFGGATPGLLSDTWEWDGVAATWSLRAPAGTPAPRSNAAIAYDPVRNITVLFGGGDPSPRADTWEYNAAGSGTWTLRMPTALPPAREQHAMTFDPLRGRIVLFGGSLADSTLWEWDPAASAGAGRWIARTASPEPPPRLGCGLAFDTARARVVLFGGAAGTSMYNDTWEWNGTTGIWSQRFSANPPASRTRAGFVYDAPRALFLVHGGRNLSVYSDTWELSSAAGPSISQQPPSRSVPTGSSTSLSVTASGAPPLAYHWRRNGEALEDGNGLVDTRAATLTINPASAIHAGTYDCIVSDGCGGVLSATATVTITTGCAADFDLNGLIQPADVALFVNAWAASLGNGSLTADFDNNGAIQPADIAAYINAWFAAATNGC